MLELIDVSIGYDKKNVVENLTFKLEKGENLCILGANGCGKSTILKAIAGLLEYSGSIKLYKNEISTLKNRQIADKIALLSQISAVYFSYSVYDTVMLGRYIRMKGGAFSNPSERDVEMVTKCLDSVGILELKDREISTLSGGQMQKVLLARTIAQEPEIIILDEPTNHLDMKSQKELFDFLKIWSKDKNHSVIGVLHDVTMAFQLFDKGLLLKTGKNVYFGDLTDITPEKLEETFDFDVISHLEDLHKPLSAIKTI